MVNYIEEIKELEKELATTPYNKRTQHHVGLIKAKIARLRESQIKRSSSKKKGEGFSVRKTGDGTVILVGYPSVGKSTLLNALTNARSKIAAYAFTTLTVIPGLMVYEHAKIQILDVPGIVKGAALGIGRGKEVLAVMRNANLVVFIIDINSPGHLRILQKEVHDTGLRVNKRKPFVKIRKTARGGIRIGATVKLTRITKQTITAILHEFKINNADVLIRDDIDAEDLIDCIEDNKVYIPGMVVLNKIDMATPAQVKKVMKETGADLAISASMKTNTEKMKARIFRGLNFIRIYLKEPNKPADTEVPLIMFKGSTLHTLCEKLHRDFVTRFRFARIWGPSAKFDGQKMVNLRHAIKDKDIIELHIA
ncbi:MAG: GTP-binding protein [DPANN group archaeon]|nr:GTP-binding protein [DPANN group archaeon]